MTPETLAIADSETFSDGESAETGSGLTSEAITFLHKERDQVREGDGDRLASIDASLKLLRQEAEPRADSSELFETKFDSLRKKYDNSMDQDGRKSADGELRSLAVDVAIVTGENQLSAEELKRMTDDMDQHRNDAKWEQFTKVAGQLNVFGEKPVYESGDEAGMKSVVEKIVSSDSPYAGKKLLEHTANMALAGRKAELSFEQEQLVADHLTEVTGKTNHLATLRTESLHKIAAADDIRRSTHGVDIPPHVAEASRKAA